MTQIAAVSRKRHAHKSWNRYTSYDFAARDCIAPLVAAEMVNAASCLPMAFVKQQNEFFLVAVLSLAPGTNLFVDPSGQWTGRYIPSAFRGYPFRLARGGEKNRLLLCVDENTGLVNENRAAGEPFFDESGEIAKPVKEIFDFLTRVEQNRGPTRAILAALADADLVVEWQLQIKAGDQVKPVTGLYRIDEKKLDRLEDAVFLKLRRARALALAYGQLISMTHMQVLEKAAKARMQADTTAPDIKAVFGDDDMISFQ
jgi:hypothetical protein